MGEPSEFLKLIPGIVVSGGGIQLDYSDLAKVLVAMAIGALGNQYIATEKLSVKFDGLSEDVKSLVKKMNELDVDAHQMKAQIIRNTTIIEREHGYKGINRNGRDE